jgi:hypothetical protein
VLEIEKKAAQEENNTSLLQDIEKAIKALGNASSGDLHSFLTAVQAKLGHTPKTHLNFTNFAANSNDAFLDIIFITAMVNTLSPKKELLPRS